MQLHRHGKSATVQMATHKGMALCSPSRRIRIDATSGMQGKLSQSCPSPDIR